MSFRSVILVLFLTHSIGCSTVNHIDMTFPERDSKAPPLFVIEDTTVQTKVSENDAFVSNDTTLNIEPTVVQKVEPVYPPLELVFEKEANVLVKIWVTRTGKVRKVVVLNSTDNQFNKAAALAAMQWVFTPAVEKGKKVSVWVSMPFRFRIKRGCAA
jgi:TonB family protein